MNPRYTVNNITTKIVYEMSLHMQDYILTEIHLKLSQNFFSLFASKTHQITHANEYYETMYVGDFHTKENK